MSKWILFILLIPLSLLNSCSSVKRHDSASFKGQDSSLADIDIFGYKLYEPHEITARGNLWDLNATAQANLLEILDRRFKDNESFLRALNNRYTSGVKDADEGDYINKNLRIILTVSKKRDYSSVGGKSNAGHPAADRIEYLKLSLKLPDDKGIKFTNWNRFATEYADIKVADISFSTGVEFTGNAGVSESEPAERSAGLSLKSSMRNEEDQEIAYRYLKMNGKLTDNKIEIEEEGTRAIDLTGNIISDVSLAFKGFPERVFLPVYSLDENGRKTIEFIGEDIMVPLISGKAEPVMAELRMDYVFRHVASGSKTFQEWDDVVEYFTGNVTKEVKLLDTGDYLPAFQCIGLQSDKKDLIMLRNARGESFTLKFRNYAEALSYLKFLFESKDKHGDIDRQIRTGEYTIVLKGEPLTCNNIPGDLIVLPFYEPAE